MSWSLQRYYKRGDDVDLKADIAKAEAMNAGGGDVAAEAWNSAVSLLCTGLLGSEDKQFVITLSGHHNPNEEPVAGWANDCVTISIVQTSA